MPRHVFLQKSFKSSAFCTFLLFEKDALRAFIL